MAHTKITLLICDDDPVVHESLGLYFKAEGMSTLSAYDGEQALQMVASAKPDLLILDIMMPRMTGIDVCREVRKGSRLPIIMLTAKGEEIDRILGLELGADDYIVKPFSPREVVARVKAVLRRHSDEPDSSAKLLRFEKLEINLDNYQVKAYDQALPLTPKEVEILYMLASHPGQVFSREQILSRVWGYEFYGDTRTVDTHIKRIRQKLPEGDLWGLRTVYGIGYKFEVS